MKWELLREEEFKEAIERSGGLCVLPIGCLEKHGQQLPVGADSLEAVGVTEAAAELEDVMVFPTGMWLGNVCGANAIENPVSKGKAGYIALKPETLLIILEELCDEIARNGFRKILIVSSHGGNGSLLQYFLSCQGSRNKSYATMTVFNPILSEVTNTPVKFYEFMLRNRSDYPMLTDEDMEVLREWADKGSWGGGHADFKEVAAIMGYHPELVAMDRLDAESGASTHRSDYLAESGVSVVNGWCANYPNAVNGYPAFGVTKTIGQALNTYCARELAKVFKLLKNDEECIAIAGCFAE